MIIDDCDIVFKNKEISKVVTLPCPPEITSTQYCETGVLNNGMCEFSICPDTYTDNGDNCKKEVPSIQQGIVLYIGRFWTGGAFGSRISVTDLSGGVGNIDNIFTNFTRTGVLSVTLNGITYSGTLTSNIVGQNQIDYDNNSDPFVSLIPNSSFTYPQQTVLGDQVDSATWNGQTYTKSITTTCPSGSSLINTKCYQLIDKIKSQEVALTLTDTKTKTAVAQKVIIEKGTVTSDISEAHANSLAKQLLDEKISNLQPKCIENPIYYNDLLVKTGKKDCSVGIPCDITVSVNSNLFQSEISKEDANNKATVELNRLFTLSVPCCSNAPQTFYSDAKNFVFSKLCSVSKLNVESPRGGNTVFQGITIPSFTSTISLIDANNKRDIWFNENKNLFESLIVCDGVPELKWNVEVIKNFGGSVTNLGNNTVLDNKEFYYSVQADEGYEISSITVDGIAQVIPNKNNYDQTFIVTSNKNVIVTFSKVFVPVVIPKTSSLFLQANIKSSVIAIDLRISYTVYTTSGVISSTSCPCSSNTKGDIGYNSPSGSMFLIGSTIPNAIISNFTQYGGSCGSTGCNSGGLGLVPVEINKTHDLKIITGSNRFVRWEFTYGTLLGIGNKVPIFGDIYSPNTTLYIPEGCDIQVTAIFE